MTTNQEKLTALRTQDSALRTTPLAPEDNTRPRRYSMTPAETISTHGDAK